MPNVDTLALLQVFTKIDMGDALVQFVNENEGVFSAYAADEIDSASFLIHVTSPRGDQHSPGERVPLEQRAYYPSSPNHEKFSDIDQTDLANIEGDLRDNVLLEPSLAATLDEPVKLQQKASTHRERPRREKSPELKFTTFQRIPQFDSFRPRPRSHFASDAMSVWPLRSIEESRLLQHFIQNLAAWVRL